MKFSNGHRVLVVAGTVLALLVSYSPWFVRFESAAYGVLGRLDSDAPSEPQLLLFTIDPQGGEGVDPWPWSRAQLANAITELDNLSAAAIGLVLPLQSPLLPPSLQDTLNKNSIPDKLANPWRSALLADSKLQRAIKNAGNVVIGVPASMLRNSDPANLSPGIPMTSTQGPEPWFLKAWRFLLAAPLSKSVYSPPHPQMGLSAAGVGATSAGHGYPRLTMSVAAQSGIQAGFSLQLLALAKGLKPSDAHLLKKQQLVLGDEHISLAADGAVYPPIQGVSSQQWLERHNRPIQELLQGKVYPTKVIQHIVLIGFAGKDIEQSNYQQALADVAAGLSAYLDNSRNTMPYWFYGGQRLLLVLLGLYLLWLPTRFRGRFGLILALGGVVVLVNLELVALLVRQLWLPMIIPALFLLLMQLLIGARHKLAKQFHELSKQLAVIRYRLAQSLQQQGQFEPAFEQLQLCSAYIDVSEAMYELGLQFERRRQFAKALSVFDALQQTNPDFKDVEQRSHHLRTIVVNLPMSSPHQVASTVVLESEQLEKPSIGRYRIERELGRGAMGVVYLGQDPVIGRSVAIKTLMLNEEFEGDALEEAKLRFVREAEAVGRLDHPNIVTVFDVGEEHDLAYIAMDYVQGNNLESYTEQDRLLPLSQVLRIALQVAEALNYAHQQGVVHRDIKPANILLSSDLSSVKVTDFGVASLVDQSKTRTGIVLGSPSYMSPEQVVGKRLDGRSDLYSLGVTLYQLVTGHMPFVGDSLANLTYRITHGKYTPVSRLRKGLPGCIGRIINKALQKEVAKRFMDGEEMAAALSRCLKKVSQE